MHDFTHVESKTIALIEAKGHWQLPSNIVQNGKNLASSKTAVALQSYCGAG